MDNTTIQLSTGLLNELKARKLSERETYEEVIYDLLEDTMQLSDETKKDIEKARAEIKAGKYVTEKELRTELGL